MVWFRAHVGDNGEPALDVFEGHGDLVALDHSADETVDYVAHVMSHWLDSGAAGWRLDAAYAVRARSGRACCRKSKPHTRIRGFSAR